jgi:hypothetical protein
LGCCAAFTAIGESSAPTSRHFPDPPFLHYCIDPEIRSRSPKETQKKLEPMFEASKQWSSSEGDITVYPQSSHGFSSGIASAPKLPSHLISYHLPIANPNSGSSPKPRSSPTPQSQTSTAPSQPRNASSANHAPQTTPKTYPSPLPPPQSSQKPTQTSTSSAQPSSPPHTQPCSPLSHQLQPASSSSSSTSANRPSTVSSAPASGPETSCSRRQRQTTST